MFHIFSVEIVYFLVRFIPRHFSFTHFFEATVNRAGLLSPFSWCLPMAHGKGAIFYWFCILLLCWVFTSSKRCFQSTCLTSSHFSKDLLNSVALTLATVSEHSQVEGSGSTNYEGLPPGNTVHDSTASQGGHTLSSSHFISQLCHVFSSEWWQHGEFIHSPHSLFESSGALRDATDSPSGLLCSSEEEHHRCVLQCVTRACTSM